MNGRNGVASMALAGLVTGGSPAVAADGLSELIAEALRASPRIEAARERARALQEAVGAAGALPDPTVGVTLAPVPIETRVGAQRAQLSVSQRLPATSRRQAAAALARAEAETAWSDYERERADLAFEVSEAYHGLYLLERSVAVTRSNRDLLIVLEELIRSAYQTGGASYSDLVRAQVEIGRLENDLAALDGQLGPARRTLNQLLHRRPDARVAPPELWTGSVVIPSAEQVAARLAASPPDVAVVDRRLVESERASQLAARRHRPDWTVSLRYLETDLAEAPGVRDSGRDPVQLGVAVSVPIWKRKYRAAERSAAVRREAVERERLDLRDRLGSRVDQALYRVRNADREVGLYRDTLLPKAEQSFSASEAGFRAATTSVLDLVDAQRVLLNFQLAYERALTERARGAAELERLLGESLVRPVVASGGDS